MLVHLWDLETNNDHLLVARIFIIKSPILASSLSKKVSPTFMSTISLIILLKIHLWAKCYLQFHSVVPQESGCKTVSKISI